MVRILANDGIEEAGKQKLIEAGFEVSTEKIAQEDLKAELNNFDVVLVRSATKIRQDLIDYCPNIKFIGRGGVGMDNIDVEYARSKGVAVENTPAASSISVAELAMAHIFNGARFIHESNRKMPAEGDTNFKNLKKFYSAGTELNGKTLGIYGFGRIGIELARMALGMNMNVIGVSEKIDHIDFEMKFAGEPIKKTMVTVDRYDLFQRSDFISFHLPFKKGQPPIVGEKEFKIMKEGVGLINTARGGVIDEQALLNALDSGKAAFAGLDVFEDEPTPRREILNHPKISLSPHIGGSTIEAQSRVWIEMADKIINHFNHN